MQRHALILNDTQLSYHFGCYATSSALQSLLIRDGYTVSTQPVHLTHFLPLPTSVESTVQFPELFAKTRTELASLYDDLNRADIVVVNGEGTLHGMRAPPKNLLFLTWVASCALEKPTFLVNHSLFPADRSPVISNDAFCFYKESILKVARIAVRETKSHEIYDSMGLHAVQAFDMLPIYAERSGITRRAGDNSSQNIVLGLGVGFTSSQACALAEAAKLTLPASAPLLFLNGGPRQDPIEERTLAQAMTDIEPRIQLAATLPYAGDDDLRAHRWLEAIANARLIITGRYHHVVAALYFGTPIIALASHTPKIEGTYDLLAIDRRTIDPQSLGWQYELQGHIRRALESDAVMSDNQQQERILELAYANSVWRQ